MYDEFIQVFGEYQPIITTANDGTVTTSIDFGYILLILFSLVLLNGVLQILKSVISAIFR